MSRPVSGTTGTEIAKAITQPFYLLSLGFDVPVRYSSMAQVTYASLLWQAASFRISMPGSGNWSVEIFNDGYLLGQTVLTQGTAGRTAQVYQLHGGGPYADADGELLLDGEMGEATIEGARVSIALKRRPPQKTPRLYFLPPHFNHLPAEGQIIRTASGTTTLGSKYDRSTWRR